MSSENHQKAFRLVLSTLAKPDTDGYSSALKVFANSLTLEEVGLMQNLLDAIKLRNTSEPAAVTAPQEVAPVTIPVQDPVIVVPEQILPQADPVCEQTTPPPVPDSPLRPPVQENIDAFIAPQVPSTVKLTLTFENPDDKSNALNLVSRHIESITNYQFTDSAIFIDCPEDVAEEIQKELNQGPTFQINADPKTIPQMIVQFDDTTQISGAKRLLAGFIKDGTVKDVSFDHQSLTVSASIDTLTELHSRITTQMSATTVETDVTPEDTDSDQSTAPATQQAVSEPETEEKEVTASDECNGQEVVDDDSEAVEEKAECAEEEEPAVDELETDDLDDDSTAVDIDDPDDDPDLEEEELTGEDLSI